MEWNVFKYDINRHVIYDYNIFEHISFRREVEKLLNEDLSKTEFAEELDAILLYYFWCKCEHEVIIEGFPPSHSDTRRKVDIFTQVHLNWNSFVNYLYDFKKTQKDD